MVITGHLKRPTRWLDRADPHCLRSTPAYLVLLRGGFTMPVLLPVRRWALTPPFHPCLIPVARAIGGLFSAALSVGSPRPGITWPTALRSPDFPLLLTAATPWPTLIGYTKSPPTELGGFGFLTSRRPTFPPMCKEVSSALWSLTAVFGMGTGVTSRV